MESCQYKVGLFVARACARPTPHKCIKCGMPVCPKHSHNQGSVNGPDGLPQPQLICYHCQPPEDDYDYDYYEDYYYFSESSYYDDSYVEEAIAGEVFTESDQDGFIESSDFESDILSGDSFDS
ncbi:MAG: hypothetical protein HRT45_15775 [Bdellovibrionales bacterium]|nr:hypothetical protein [Bdellovibrionales bacterium]